MEFRKNGWMTFWKPRKIHRKLRIISLLKLLKRYWVTGGKPEIAQPVGAGRPFEHPHVPPLPVMNNIEELERALNSHGKNGPHSRTRIKERFKRNTASLLAFPDRLALKTTVALHRAVNLARKHTDARVLLTTFSETLAASLRVRLHISRQWAYCGNGDSSIDRIGQRIAESNWGTVALADPAQVRSLINGAAENVDESRFTDRFLWDEWVHVVDAWQIESWKTIAT